MDMGYKQLRASLFFLVFTVLILVLAGVLDAELGDKHSANGNRGNYGPSIFGARGKRRGFSPGAAARHSQYVRVHTEFLS